MSSALSVVSSTCSSQCGPTTICRMITSNAALRSMCKCETDIRSWRPQASKFAIITCACSQPPTRESES
eukprot:426517-Amphidinium_carterae.1